MVVPLPRDDVVLLVPPDEAEAIGIARGVATAVAGAEGLTDLQDLLLQSVLASMTGFHVEFAALDPMDGHGLAEHLARRNLAFRSRILQTALLAALILHPLAEEVVDRLAALATEMGVDCGLIDVARDFADGAFGLAGVDFERNGYTSEWHPDDAAFLHTSGQLKDAWDLAVDDPALAARWRALEDLPDGTIGHQVTRLYRARGFTYPGTPGSAPPLLAQHDWVHVLADYGTTVDSELEVFALIARANDDMRAFSLLAMVVSLFETGYLQSGAGLFQADTGHLTADHGTIRRMTDAMRRGARTHDSATGSDSIDFLTIDWFSVADLPVERLRERFGLVPKTEEALAAGSVGPWQAGGISPFQVRCGKAAAEAAGTPYDSGGASPARHASV